MLAQAQARAGAVGVELDLRRGDMRDLALGEPAGNSSVTESPASANALKLPRLEWQ
jgi:hypothetical protein